MSMSNMLKNFERCFPSQYVRMEKCYEYSVDSLLVITKSGQKMVYDDSAMSIRMIYNSGNGFLEDYRIEFAKNLKTLIPKAGMSQSEFANRIGVSKRTCLRYLSGESLPDAYMIRKMKSVLGFEYSAILDLL